jgi:hypothetical protein
MSLIAHIPPPTPDFSTAAITTNGQYSRIEFYYESKDAMALHGFATSILACHRALPATSIGVEKSCQHYELTVTLRFKDRLYTHVALGMGQHVLNTAGMVTGYSEGEKVQCIKSRGVLARSVTVTSK